MSEKRGWEPFMKKKQIWRWILSGCGTLAILLTILTIFNILPLFWTFIAMPLFIADAIYYINEISDHYARRQIKHSPKI
jgi:hypothetical protein